ncbi:MAG: hypothetical protein B6D55_05510 [Candidatus Omnitrophica bacterium 4484_70.2]|nr:MAG: hypothetical protein B6D55_05510 [Candidatus Omnitrophica bacterium 4484_70.2]
MPYYIYKVRDKEGKIYIGALDVDDKKTLRNILYRSGFFVVKIQPYKEKRGLFAPKVSLDSLIIFTHQLSSMISGGIPILTCLEILWKQTENRRLQLVISQLKNKLTEGEFLSDALDSFPDVFPEIYRSLIRVAERGGGLAPVLQKLVEYLTKQRQMRMKVKRASTYPLIVSLVAVSVVIFMLVRVVPVYQKVFARLHTNLPGITQFLLHISNFVKHFWWMGFIVVGFAVFLYKKITSYEKGRYTVDKIKIKLPALGKIFYIASVGRFVYALSLLLEGGLPISHSMDIAKRCCENKVLEKALEGVERKIAQGQALGSSLEETHAFPVMFTQMVSIGEESGTLIEMLNKVSLHIDEDLDYKLDRFLTLIEPALIIVVGVIVAVILLAMYAPIFTLWRSIKG